MGGYVGYIFQCDSTSVVEDIMQEYEYELKMASQALQIFHQYTFISIQQENFNF